MTKILRVVFSVLLLLAAFAFVLSRADWQEIAGAVSRLSWASLVVATVAMAAGALLASLRLQLIASDLGYRLSFRDSVSALALGHLMGSLFFQLAGQLMARSALLSRRRVPVSGTIVITGYERVTALVISVVLAVSGAIYLFGHVSLDLAQGGTTFIKLVAGLSIGLVAGAAYAWGPLLWRALPHLTTNDFVALSRNLAISLAIQLTTMLSYVILAKSVAPGLSVLNILAAATLVMLAASLPISLAGWGMREMSAIFALGTIGLSAEASLAVAVSVGVISFAVVGIMAFSAIGHHRRPALAHHQAARMPFDYGALLDYALPVIAASAVFFQIFLPINKGLINVNLADPVVLLGGAVFVVHHFGDRWPQWRLPQFSFYVAVATAALVLGYLHGLLSIGWIDWAFANRLLGWFVLLCYGATAALLVHRKAGAGLELVLRTFVISAAAITVLELVLFTLARSGVSWLQPLTGIPFVGFSQNRNAFALQLLLSFCVLLVRHWRGNVVLLAITFAGIWFAGSRAAFLAVPVVLVVAAFMGSLDWRKVAGGLILGVAIVAFAHYAPVVILQVVATIPGRPFVAPGEIFTILISAPSSNEERIKSLIGGWQMFIEHPILGAGLGAFMDQETRAGAPLVIHSTPLWLLAELGVVGFLIFVTPLLRIFFAEVDRRYRNDSAGILLTLIITTFAVVSNVHDIMYQRAFWLLFGACMALTVSHRRRSPGH